MERNKSERMRTTERERGEGKEGKRTTASQLFFSAGLFFRDRQSLLTVYFFTRLHHGSRRRIWIAHGRGRKQLRGEVYLYALS